jgi:hypothetical protein
MSGSVSAGDASILLFFFFFFIVLSMFLQLLSLRPVFVIALSTDQLCLVFGNVHESQTPWKKGGKKLIQVDQKWREKMRPDFSKCDYSYVVRSHRASRKKSEL